MASQLSNIPKEQSCSINCEICRKFISEPTDRYAICGKTKNFTEDLQQFNVPLSKDGYLCKSCVRKLQKHRKIKENLEKSAVEIKSLLRSSLKRGPNVVDEGSSIYFPVIKKPHVDVSTSKPNPNTSSTTPVLGTKTPLMIFPHASTQLTIPVPLHTSTPVKKLKKLSFSKEPTTNSPKPETTVKVNCMRCRDESVVVLIYVFLLKVTWRRLYCLPLRVAGLNYRARLFESWLTKSRISVNFGLLF